MTTNGPFSTTAACPAERLASTKRVKCAMEHLCFVGFAIAVLVAESATIGRNQRPAEWPIVGEAVYRNSERTPASARRTAFSAQAAAPVVTGPPVDADYFTIVSVNKVSLTKTLVTPGGVASVGPKQVFVVVDAAVFLKSDGATISTKDLVLKGAGGSVFHLLGFIDYAEKPPVFRGGGIESRFSRSKGGSLGLGLVFGGAAKDATGELTLSRSPTKGANSPRASASAGTSNGTCFARTGIRPPLALGASQ
jgi:hypothetical protein